MKRIIVALSLALAFGLIYFLWAHHRPSVAGVWKGTDETGHEHYFNLHEDGTLTWWDRDRSPDGGFTERPHFRGSYRYEDRQTIVAQSDGWPPQPLGILTIVSENELKQSGGDSMRRDLVYRRVARQ